MTRRRGYEGLWSDDEDETPKSGPADGDLTPKRLDWLARAAKDPHLYLWGKDPETDRPVIHTLDAFDKENRIKPLPLHKGKPWAVHHELVEILAVRQESRVLIEKVRQVMFSWFAVLLMDHLCRFAPYRRALFMKSTKDEAVKVVGERWEVVNQHLPEWVKVHSPGTWMKSDGVVVFGKTESRIMTAGENVEEREARGDQIDKAVVDECALHPRLADIVGALEPMAAQIVLATTPQLGPGALYVETIINEGREKAEEDE